MVFNGPRWRLQVLRVLRHRHRPHERVLGDLAGLLRETRGELKPAGPIDELTVPGGEDF